MTTITDIPTLFDEPEPELPVLPYGGSSGWSGSDSSKERADRDDRTGNTSKRQAETLALLHLAGPDGLTWQELSRHTTWHHGKASGVLSALHKANRIFRLAQRRNGCQIYVHLDFVHGRPGSEYQPNVSARLLKEILTEIETDLIAGHGWQALRRIQATLRAYDE